MPVISNLPRGLLELLGLQSFGETPRNLSDVVVGTVDLNELFLLNRMQAALGSDAAPALGSRFFTTTVAGFPPLTPVPNNELWYLHEFHVSASPGAATAITVQPRIRASNTSLVYTTPVTITGAAGNPTVMVPANIPRGLWLPPGSEFSYLVSAITGAPGAVDGVAWISRFGSTS